MLDYGDFQTVRNVLLFLGTHQDLNGKILHEYTTSGFIHYDAADATPLYILLMGRYVKASSDNKFAREQFSHLQRAIDFCFSTDTDGDHLIENTSVGHGWVEGGGLFPVHTEHYLASIWSAALDEAATVAVVLRKLKPASSWRNESKTVAKIVKKEFWNPQTNFYNFAKRQDGSFNAEKTILPAVGISLGIADPEHIDAGLVDYASANFSADWGTRIIGKDNPMFNPTGYHYGSVWPLFTGWNALAQFRWQHYPQGFQTVASNLAPARVFSAGTIAEVLRGDSLEEAGVCSHQAWSETMALQPLLEGMLGLRVNALKSEIELRPWFPPDWNEAAVENIRIGNQRVSFAMKRIKNGLKFEFRGPGRNVKVKFQPMLMLGTKVEEVRVGKNAVSGKQLIRSYSDSPQIEFVLRASQTVNIVSAGGVGVVPPPNELLPNQSSNQLRILDERWRDGEYGLMVEGLAGASYNVQVVDPANSLRAASDNVQLERNGSILTARVSFGGTSGFVRQTLRLR